MLKRTATITQAGVGSQILRSGTGAFKTLRCAVEVGYIFVSVKEITIKFLVREKTTRKELHPLELTSKVTTEFAYNGTSRGLQYERYLSGAVCKNIISDRFSTKTAISAHI